MQITRNSTTFLVSTFVLVCLLVFLGLMHTSQASADALEIEEVDVAANVTRGSDIPITIELNRSILCNNP